MRQDPVGPTTAQAGAVVLHVSPVLPAQTVPNQVETLTRLLCLALTFGIVLHVVDVETSLPSGGLVAGVQYGFVSHGPSCLLASRPARRIARRASASSGQGPQRRMLHHRRGRESRVCRYGDGSLQAPTTMTCSRMARRREKRQKGGTPWRVRRAPGSVG